MSSADPAAAQKAAGQLKQDAADLHGNKKLESEGEKQFDQAQGTQDAHKGTGEWGFSPSAGAEDTVKDNANEHK